MKKADIIAELTEWQTEGWSKDMTTVELRSILKIIRDPDGGAGPCKGFSKKKLAELQDEYRSLGLGEPGKLTRGLLMLEIRHEVYRQQGGSEKPKMTQQKPKMTQQKTTPTTTQSKTKATSSAEQANPTEPPPHEEDKMIMDFGRHKHLSYQQVLDDHPQYCIWVLEMDDQEPDCSEQLARFAQYLREKGLTKDNLKKKKAAPWIKIDESED